MTELAQITQKGKLVSESEWQKHILFLRKKAGRPSQKLLQQAIVEAIGKRIPREKFGVLFSGGVDSSLIALLCKKLKADFTCYTVGLENAEDLIKAREAAEQLKIDLRMKILDLNDVKSILKKLAKILPDFNVVSASVGLVNCAAMEMVKKDGLKSVFTGLGSDEIFAGTGRHQRALDKQEQCWRGLAGMYHWDFERDMTIVQKLKMKMLTPYLDSELIERAMAIPISQKISQTEKKIILRQIAEKLGLPAEIAWRKKKSSQYGSKVDKAVEKLAKAGGFKGKREYIESLNSCLVR